LLVRANAIAYDLRYAMPAFLLLLLWVPLFGGVVFILVTGLLKLSCVLHLLNHTGAGRIAVGGSAPMPMYPDVSRRIPERL
jgi:hypothetical protein